MAFALKKTNTVTRAVPLVQYNEDGSEAHARLNIRFKVIPRSKLDALIHGEADGEATVAFDLLVDGIADTVTSEGEALSEADALALVREDLILSGQITSYYFKFLSGVAEKNAPKSPAR